MKKNVIKESREVMDKQTREIIRTALFNNNWRETYAGSMGGFLNDLDKKLNIEIKGK